MEINKVVKYGEKYGDVTVVLSSEEKDSLDYSNGKVFGFTSGKNTTLEVRISRGKKFGYSFTTNLKEWKGTVNKAAKIMKLSKELEFDIPIVTKKKLPKVSGVYSKDVRNLLPENLFSLGESLINSVNNKFNIPKASVSKLIQETHFANSNGVNLSHKETGFSSYVEVVKDNVNTYDFHESHGLYDVSKVGRSASKLLESKINSKSIKSFKGDILFDYFAVADLFDTVIVRAVLANNVQNRKSILYGKLGEKVFSDKLTIYDNGILKGGLNSSPFDGEGEIRQKTKVIEKGVLKNFLYDNYSAIKDGEKSTGNSAGIDIIPKISPTNFIIKKGKYSEDKLISEIKDGLFVRDIVGTHLINPVTGDCSVGIDDAFYVKNGEVKFAVKHAMISFNLFDSLKNLEMIGKKVRQESNIVAPQILLKDIQVVA